jgi:hypothetical protein
MKASKEAGSYINDASQIDMFLFNAKKRLRLWHAHFHHDLCDDNVILCTEQFTKNEHRN